MGRDELLELLAQLREQVALALGEDPNAKIRERLEQILRLTEGLEKPEGDEDEAS